MLISSFFLQQRRLFAPTPLIQIVVLVLLASSTANNAQALEPPKLKARVNDYARLLNRRERKDLESRLARYERKTGHQFALLTIPSLDGDPLEDFSIRVVEAWKLGDKVYQDGLLMLIVKEGRKVRVEVGYGLEGVIPDIVANRVMEEVITPSIKLGHNYPGILEGFRRFMKAAENEALHPSHKPRHHSYRWLVKAAPLLIFLVFMAGSFMIPIVFGLIGAVIGTFIHPVFGFFGFIAGLFLGISLVARGGGGGPGGPAGGEGGGIGGGPGFIWIGSGGFGNNYGDGEGGMDFGGFEGGGGDFGGGGASGDW